MWTSSTRPSADGSHAIWVRVARVGKPFGVRGQVTVQVFTDVPEERLTVGAELAFDDEGTRPVVVTGVQRSGSRWVLALSGVADREEAEALRGEQLFAPADDTAAAVDDEWFDWQLVGMTCVDPHGTVLGDVAAVEHPPAHDLLVVATPQGQLVRVPFVSEIVPQVDDGRLVIDAPGGLFEDP